MKIRLMMIFSLIMLAVLSVAAEDGKLTIEHKIRVDRAGTRSEARHGYLFVNGKAFPDNFYVFSYDGGLYYFHQRTTLWGDDGYFPVPEPEKSVGENLALTADELDRGWYEGKKIRPGLPIDWIYVEWKDTAAFVAYDKIEAFIQFYKIPRIPREPELF